MVNDKAAIAVLGPASDAAPEAAIASATELGRRLGKAGYAVVGVGSAGCGPAAVAASLQVDAPSLLVTSGRVPVGCEKASLVEVAGPLRQLETALDRADAIFFLAGDLTALAALLLVWSHGRSPDGPYRQLVLVGPDWRGTVKALAEAAKLDQRDRAMVTFADSAELAIESVRYYVSPEN